MDLGVKEVLEAARAEINSTNRSDDTIVNACNERRKEVIVAEDLFRRARNVGATRKGSSKGILSIQERLV